MLDAATLGTVNLPEGAPRQTLKIRIGGLDRPEGAGWSGATDHPSGAGHAIASRVSADFFPEQTLVNALGLASSPASLRDWSIQLAGAFTKHISGRMAG
jgi:hypothetical protein